jgi:hypothetical protein
MESESSFATDPAGQPSLRLGFEPPLGLMTRSLLLVVVYCFVFLFWSILSAEMTVSPIVSNIYFCNIHFYFYFLLLLYILIFIYIFCFLYLYFFPSSSFLFLSLRQAAWCAASHASAVRQFRHLNGRTRDRHQVSVFCVFGALPHLFLCCEHSHCHDFEWLLPVSCISLLWSHIHTEFGRSTSFNVNAPTPTIPIFVEIRHVR